jgi:hypothetical protein
MTAPADDPTVKAMISTVASSAIAVLECDISTLPLWLFKQTVPSTARRFVPI